MKLAGYSRSSGYNFVIHKMKERVVCVREETDRGGDGGREKGKEVERKKENFLVKVCLLTASYIIYSGNTLLFSELPLLLLA